jgi:hypothetical protein
MPAVIEVPLRNIPRTTMHLAVVFMSEMEFESRTVEEWKETDEQAK